MVRAGRSQLTSVTQIGELREPREVHEVLIVMMRMYDVYCIPVYSTKYDTFSRASTGKNCTEN
jgi:hypothetical protein